MLQFAFQYVCAFVMMQSRVSRAYSNINLEPEDDGNRGALAHEEQGPLPNLDSSLCFFFFSSFFFWCISRHSVKSASNRGLRLTELCSEIGSMLT